MSRELSAGSELRIAPPQAAAGCHGNILTGGGCALTSEHFLLSGDSSEIVMECFKSVDLLYSIKYLVDCSKY